MYDEGKRPQRLLLITVGLILLASMATAGQGTVPFADYRTESWYLPQSPGVTGGPVAGLFNPAAFAITDRAGLDFWWDDQDIRKGLDNYGLSMGRNLGFAMQARTLGVQGDSYKVYDYQLGFAGGSRAGTFGMAYRWSNGETDRAPRQQVLSIGGVSRPTGWLSFGSAANVSLESSSAQYIFDLGIRPLGRQWLTLFADWTANNDERFFYDGTWSAGLEVRPVSGLHLGFRAREILGSDDLGYSAMVGLTFGGLNASYQQGFDKDGNQTVGAGLLRATPPFPGLPIDMPLLAKPTYFPISLENKYLTYQNYRLFDKKRVAWLDLLSLLNKLRDDTTLKGVALNLAGFQARPSLIWELRQKLQEIRDTGKEVIIHTDRMGLSMYWLASVADHLTVDEQGAVPVPGYALSRSYVKGALEKLGLGFQEFRYFKYKSAAEALSRDSMSEADREQRQRIVDVLYEGQRAAAMDGRNLSEADFDRLVDEQAILMPHEALEAGLIDGVSRWDQLPKWLAQNRSAMLSAAPWITGNRSYWDGQWGDADKIPVVYAVGVCAMDSGIKGRETSEYLRKLIRDPAVKAVVLRADSPGGDPLPSDLVADAVRQLKAAGKPVIISQGDVAASGGYWISMDGTKVLTTPLTITGSIGVIGGWIWNDGLADKMGITSDTVYRGKHADLMSTVSLPFLGQIPNRAMNDDELTRVEKTIRHSYDGFVNAVAKGRNMAPETVAEIAQGRVWMGGDAIDNGLCDSFGTLDDAIQLARKTANIPDWRDVEIVEYPPRPLFKFPSFGPNLPGLMGLGTHFNQFMASMARKYQGALAATEALNETFVGAPGLSDLDVQYLKAVADAPGQPLLMVSPDLLPDGWDQVD